MIRIQHIRQNLHYLRTTIPVLAGIIVISGALLFGGIASAAAGKDTTSSGSTTNGSATSNASVNQQERIQNIIAKGDQEIARRLTTLNTLSSKISAATHLTPSDQSTLSLEVSSTISGLGSLKSSLDSATIISTAHTDAEDIYTEYRVYALVAPKVGLIKVADDQQVVQSKLTAMSAKLQTRITAAQKSGGNASQVQTMQSELTDLNNQVAAANKISSTIETSVIGLQPTDYNSNHSVLSGDNTQLKTAHADDQAAVNDARDIITTLKAM
jgi:hypothetical protein